MAVWSWIDGRPVAASTAMVKAADRGWLYGDGIFETMRLYDGNPFLVGEHLARLMAAAEFLEIENPYESNDLQEAIASVIRANGIASGVVRLTISRGTGGRGLLPARPLKPTVAITVSAGISYDDRVYLRGLRAVILPWPRNERSPLARIKSTSCLENVLGAKLAGRAGVEEGLFLNTAGLLAEGAKTNIFLVQRGRFFTPPVNSGALPGILRNFLIAQGGFPVEERELSATELFQAEEAFLTNSVLGAAPLVEVDGKPIGTGRPGPCTEMVMAWYREQVWHCSCRSS